VIGIVIVAHGGLAQEYLATMTHVVGPQRGVRAVSINTADDRTRKENEICATADDVDAGDGVIIVADMFGASPSNLSLAACKRAKRRILYGMNLPMLIKLAKSRNLDVGDAALRATEAGRKYIDSHNVSSD
jgi:PTS system mannose-specific IIA component